MPVLEWKERAFEFQMFLLISDGHISAPKRCTNMASQHKAIQRCVRRFGKKLRNCEPQIKGLRLWQIVYILVFYNISFSWLLPLDGFQFIFLLRDSENDLYKQVVWDENNWLWFVFPSYRTAQVLKKPNQGKDLCLILALWQDYT